MPCFSDIDDPSATERLVRMWDRGQWSAARTPLDQDVEQWHGGVVPKSVADAARRVMAAFWVGEHAGIDALLPIVQACDYGPGRTFLVGQCGDEARHTHLMDRLVGEFIPQLASANPGVPHGDLVAPGYWKISELERHIVDELQSDTSTEAEWVRAITIFHLVTEAVLAVDSQKRLVRVLGKLDLLPGVRKAFVRLARDEARHVSFGLNELRAAVDNGFSGPIVEVLEEATPMLWDYAGPKTRTTLRSELFGALDSAVANIELPGEHRSHLISLRPAEGDG